ncbi:hypothetical protein ACFY7C_11945 [Streptomyces sp. NPDC012769]|uniref:hypothetical protein n=1 Tax=Streptomyces sp. NPDC012769 TaxID=3364848 RepID=UPI003691FDB4
MNRYHVTAPDPGFSGEFCGVAFTDGAAVVSDDTKEGRAAIEYFRRRGYVLDAAPDANSSAGRDTAGDDEPFDPAAHDAAEVIDYLNTLDEDPEVDAEAEFARVIASERASKARKTVLALAEEG